MELKAKRILGIDPGLNKTGYAVVDSSGSGCRRVCSGVLNVPKGELAQRLGFIFTELHKIVEEFHPDCSAIEKTFLNTNAQSSLLLAHARGVAMSVPAFCGLSCREFSTREIKKSVTGYGAADKEQVAAMVLKLLGESGDFPPDETDAIATAICCANSLKLLSILPAQKTVGVSATANARLGGSGGRSRSQWTKKYGDIR